MSQEDLPAAFYNLQSLQQRDGQHFASTADAVQHNSVLLNAVVNRLNSVEAVLKLTTDSVNGMGAETKGAFKQAEKLNGLDVWRRIVAPMKPKTVSREVELHTEVNSPPKCKGISNIIEHLDKWEKDLDE